MNDLLTHPAIQAGVAPFIIAFIISLIFVRISLLAGLALLAGFASMVLSTTGFSFSPMTSTHKLTLLVLFAPVIAMLFQFGVRNLDASLKLFGALAGLAVLWVLWPVIARGPLGDILVPTLTYVFYAIWMTGMFARMSEMPAITAGTSVMASGIAIGGAALIGASALLGQMGIALGAAGGAYLLVQLLFRNEEPAALTFTLTGGLMAALLLPMAIVYAKVPWLVLPLVALIPLISYYPFVDDEFVWRNTACLLVPLAGVIALVFYLSWQSAGAVLL